MLSDPGGPPPSTTAARRCCLPPIGRRRLPRQILISGLNRTPAHSLSTLRRVDYSTATQESLPDGWPTFPGGAGYPLGPTERFQLISSFFPRLLLAHPIYSIRNQGFASVRPSIRSKPMLLASVCLALGAFVILLLRCLSLNPFWKQCECQRFTNGNAARWAIVCRRHEACLDGNYT